MSSTLFCPNFSVNLRSYTICQCYPESWARYIHTQSEENQVSTYNTTTLQHSKMSSLSPTNPASGNFCRSAYWQVQRLHIQHHCFNFLWWSVEDLKAKWELITERSRHKQALLTLQLHFWSLFINCCFNHKLFHWACMKNFCLHSLMKFVQKRDFEQLCISQIETSTSLLMSFCHLCACEMSLGWGHLITWMDPSVGHLNGILAPVGWNLNNNFQNSQMPGGDVEASIWPIHYFCPVWTGDQWQKKAS